MRRTVRHAVAISTATDGAEDGVLDGLFPQDTIAALQDGRRGELILAPPPLECPRALLDRLGAKSSALIERADAYASVVAPWFVFSPGVRVAACEVTCLSMPWQGFASGALVLQLRTSKGDVAFIRDDVTFDHRSGRVLHHRLPAIEKARLAAFGVPDGSAGDAALTIAEYAAFLIPGVGPIAAGVMNVFHNWIRAKPRKGLPNEAVVEEIGALLKKLLVQEDEAGVIGSYVNYQSAMRNANDDDPKSVEFFADVVRSALDLNGALKRAFDDLTYVPAIANAGVRAWSFAASYQVLALRHGMELDARASGEPIHASDYWRRLHLVYRQVLSHLGAVVWDEQRGLCERLARIGEVTEFTHTQSFCVEGPGGRGQCKDETYLDGFGFTDDGRRVCLKVPAKHKDNEDLRRAALSERAAYVASKRDEFLRAFYQESDQAVAGIRGTSLSLLRSWHDSFEDTVLSAVKGWRPPQAPPALSAWPHGPTTLAIEAMDGVQARPWRDFLPLDAGEIASEMVSRDAPVFCHIGPGKGRLLIDPPRRAGKTYALRVRYRTEDELRWFRVQWEGVPVSDADAFARVAAPCSMHAARDHVWQTRTVTLPVQAPDGDARLVIEGCNASAPEVVSVEWFELEHLPVS